MILKKLFGFVPVFKHDQSKHRQYTLLWEDLCQ